MSRVSSFYCGFVGEKYEIKKLRCDKNVRSLHFVKVIYLKIIPSRAVGFTPLLSIELGFG